MPSMAKGAPGGDEEFVEAGASSVATALHMWLVFRLSAAAAHLPGAAQQLLSFVCSVASMLQLRQCALQHVTWSLGTRLPG